MPTGLMSPAGPWLWRLAMADQAVCWLVFAVGSVAIWLRADRQRQQAGSVEGTAIKSRASLWGLGLEVLAFAVVWKFRRPSPEQVPLIGIGAAMLLAPACVALLLWAMAHLGKQLRIQAVVAADHQLVASGPYGLVRHPIYASLLGTLTANALVASRWEAGFVGAVICIIGTEIRIRVEDGLLAIRFPEAVAAYRSRVRAYLPFIR